MKTQATLGWTVALLLLAGVTAALAQSKPPQKVGPSDTSARFVLPSSASGCVASVVGAPEAIGKAIESGIAKGLAAAGHDFRGACTDSGYTLRAYVVAASKPDGIKLDYVIDVIVGQGRRVGRAFGGQVLPPTQSKDPWASLTQGAAESLGETIAAKLLP